MDQSSVPASPPLNSHCIALNAKFEDLETECLRETTVQTFLSGGHYAAVDFVKPIRGLIFSARRF